METPALPLVLTKLRVPTPRPRLVPRAHLTDRLTRETGSSLVLVCAPVGYGKTTLLAEWAHSLRQAGVAVAWLALDAGDDAPGPFGAYLVASLAHALGPTSELAHLAQRLRSSPEIDLQTILPAIINAVAAGERECVLVLDDYHLINAPAIHTAVAFLLERLPDMMRVAIGSRVDPPLPLARLRAQGRLREIRAAELRFTGEETARYLNDIMQLGLSTKAVTALDARTEGWIAALQLAALALASRQDRESFVTAFAGSHRYLVEYLLEEVVSRQSGAVQSFLLATSILERLCGPLCDALLGRGAGRQGCRGEGDSAPLLPGAHLLRQPLADGVPPLLSNSQALLEHLERANLFVVALDEQAEWYRYHHLFRDFLLARLHKTEPERVAGLHRAASEWHAAHGLLREAVQHALQTGDWGYAAARVEQHGVSLMMRNEIATVSEWCAAFPEEIIRAHPTLCLLQGNTLVVGYRQENRGRIEARLQQVEQAAALLDDQALAHVLMGQAAASRTFLAAMMLDPAADPRSHFALAQRALDLLAADDPARSAVMLTIGYAHMALHDAAAGDQAMDEARQLSLRCRYYFGVIEAAFHQARLAHAQGQLQHAADLCQQAEADVTAVLPHPEVELPALACLSIASGSVLLEQDRLAAAEQALLRGLESTWGMMPYYHLTAYVALFRLREIQGRSAEALACLARLEEAWPDFAFCTRALRVIHALRLAPDNPATLADAAMWSRAFSASLGDPTRAPGIGPWGGAEAYYLAGLAWARAQIAIGQAQAALAYLARQLDCAQAHGLTTRIIELSLLEAQACHAAGDDSSAWVALERALLAAQPGGHVRSFDQGAALTALLAEAARRGICPDSAGRILAVVGVPDTGRVGQGAETALPGDRLSQAAGLVGGERLSGRELEVLRLMARGASNHEIARQLVITVGTVKSHVNHILEKLGAHNRTEAVARAREAGLLEM